MNLPIKNSPAYVIKSVAMGRDKYFGGVTAVSPEWTSPCHSINDQLHRLWIWIDVDSDVFWSGPCSFHIKKEVPTAVFEFAHWLHRTSVIHIKSTSSVVWLNIHIHFAFGIWNWRFCVLWLWENERIWEGVYMCRSVTVWVRGNWIIQRVGSDWLMQ